MKKYGFELMEKQVRFLHLSEGDTLVDIGSQSGWFSGVIGKISPVKNLHVLLVDIDSSCLNQPKLDAMNRFYTSLGSRSAAFSYEILVNTTTTMPLQGGLYKKVMVRNTLHEVEDKQLFINLIAAAMKSKGELILIEEDPMGKTKLHKGCHKPLLSFTEINTLMEAAGLRLKEKQPDQYLKTMIQLLRYVKD